VVDSTLNSFDIGFVPDPFSSCEVPFPKKKRLKFLVKISRKSSDVRASNDFTRVGFGQKKIIQPNLKIVKIVHVALRVRFARCLHSRLARRAARKHFEKLAISKKKARVAN
jgi:hypothetical protein